MQYRTFRALSLLCLFYLGQPVKAAVFSIHGRLSLQTVWYDQIPTLNPKNLHYRAMRLPLSLNGVIQPNDRLSIQISQHITFQEFPNLSAAFGQNAHCHDHYYETVPFLQTNCRFYNQPNTKSGPLALVTYSTEVGKFFVGQRYLHWGLGIWQNSRLPDFGGKQDRVDGIGYVLDFSPFQIGLFYDIHQYSSVALSPLSRSFTIQILKDEKTSEINQFQDTTMGFAYSHFSSSYKKTRLSIFDLTGSLKMPLFLVAFEGIWLGGRTESEAYEWLGGGRNFLPKTINSWGGMIEGECLFTGDKQTEIMKIRHMKDQNPTVEWNQAQTLRLQSGIASGQESQFKTHKYNRDLNQDPNSLQKITGYLFHTNIRPTLLMHLPESAFFASDLVGRNMDIPIGLSQRFLTNSLFIKGEYTFLHPQFGAISPSITWSRLWVTPFLKEITQQSVNPEEKLPNDLGIEIDVAYRYRRVDLIGFLVEGGIWWPGQAWSTYRRLQNNTGPTKIVLGLRMAAQYQF